MKLFITLFFLSAALSANTQTLEWQLVNPVFNPTDPDGGGPATGSVTFTLQVHTTSGTLSNVTGLSTGWSWQSANAMLPTGSPCGTNSVTQPANITMSSAFAGFTYNNVDECSGSVNFSNGSQTFDRRASGTVDGGTITLTTTFVDVFTVTLWTLGNSSPQGGYVVINSGNGGSPGPFSTYAVSDALANEYVVNSLTYTTALALGNGVVPVTFSSFNANCTANGVMISWTTATESNSNYFEVQRSMNGNTWTSVGTERASGSSTGNKNYQHLDVAGGNALYRVKQVDIDGKIIYTNILSSNCTQNNTGFVIYPVPAHDQLTIVIRSEKASKIQLQLTDAVGRLIKIIDAKIEIGNNSLGINVSGLAPGEYFIHGSDKLMNPNKKFTIVR